MKKMRILALVLLAIFSFRCQQVLVQHPIGNPVSEDLSKIFDGSWQTDDGKYVFSVKANAGGQLDVAGIEWRDGHFMLRDTVCLVTKVGDWYYLNVPSPRDSTGKKLYLFAPFIANPDGKFMTIFVPSADYFKDAIDKKELAGKYQKEPMSFILVEDSTQQFEAKTGEIIRSSHALVLKRTRNGLNKEAWPMEK